MAQFSKRFAAESEALSEEVDNLCAAIDRALTAASTAAANAEDGHSWVDAVVHLESAKAIMYGNGPGGDL